MRTYFVSLFKCLACSVVVAGFATSAHAQHPIDVQKLSSEGEHMKALISFEKLPERRITAETRLAAAKSSWALGLNSRAAEQFDTLLRESKLPVEVRARVTLSRGVLEYQEERYPEAALYAEKAVSLLKEPSALRARALLLWGQSLTEAHAYTGAENTFTAALDEAAPEDLPEINFALGKVRVKIGKFAEAEKHFEAIPVDHDRAPASIRNLAFIALETDRVERAQVWLEKGRTSFPDAFLDSWAEYGLLRVAISKGDMPAARKIVERAVQQYPPSDTWLIVMQSALEGAEWSRNGRAES